MTWIIQYRFKFKYLAQVQILSIHMLNNLLPDFQLLFENLPGLHLVLKPDFTIMAASNSYLHATMIRREEVMGKSMFDVFPDNPADEHADGSTNLRASLNYVLQHRKPHKMAIQKYDVRRPDGVFEERYWSPLNSPVLDVLGNLCCILHYAEDVTEKQKKQKEIDFLSLQIERAQDAIYTVDEHLQITNWNIGAQKLYGYSREEVIGKHSHEILQTDPDDLEKFRQTHQIEQGDYQTGEFKRKNKAGKSLWVQFSISTIRDGNKITGYVVVSFDVTEQKILREKVNHLARIVENSSEAIFSRGLDQRIISWNIGAEKLFGFSKQEAIGKTADELGFIRLQPEEIKNIQTTIVRYGSWRSERVLFHKNGTEIFGDITANCNWNEYGDVSSFYFIVRDISFRKKLEEHLKHANEKLEYKVKERTAAIAASEKKYHYLFNNNPLPMWIADTQTLRFLDVNETALEHYGFSREEFLSMTLNDIRTQEDKEDVSKMEFLTKSNTGVKDPAIWSHIKKDGTVIRVQMHTHQINFGSRQAVLILVDDVTEKLLAEEKLTANEKRFRTLIEKAHDVITLMDASFKLIYRSPAAERITGWSNSDMINVDATRNIHTDDMEEARSIVAQVMSTPGVTFKTLFRNQHKDGHYIWLEGELTNWLHDENVQAIVFNYRDVTERMTAAEKIAASEQRFRSTLDNMIEGVQIIDFNWKYTYVNKAFTKNARFSKKELLGATLMEKFPGIADTTIYKYCQRCFDEKKPV